MAFCRKYKLISVEATNNNLNWVELDFNKNTEKVFINSHGSIDLTQTTKIATICNKFRIKKTATIVTLGYEKYKKIDPDFLANNTKIKTIYHTTAIDAKQIIAVSKEDLQIYIKLLSNRNTHFVWMEYYQQTIKRALLFFISKISQYGSTANIILIYSTISIIYIDLIINYKWISSQSINFEHSDIKQIEIIINQFLTNYNVKINLIIFLGYRSNIIHDLKKEINIPTVEFDNIIHQYCDNYSHQEYGNYAVAVMASLKFFKRYLINYV